MANTEPEGSDRRALSLRVRPDGVAVIIYDVPGEPVNTLKLTFAAELERLVAEIARDPAVKAAILVSGKPDDFIAGADIAMLELLGTATEAAAMCRAGHASIARVVASPKPIVAAVHGVALGGGFEVALACHGRVLSDDKRTVLGFPEVQLGVLPGLNGLERLAEKVGLQVALDHGLTGRRMRAARARELGVADDVVPVAALQDAAAALALRLAAQGAPFSRRPARKSTLRELALENNRLGRLVLFRQARARVRATTGGHYPAPERIVEVLEIFAEKGLAAAAEAEARAFGELVVSSVAHRLIELFFAQTALKKDSGVTDPGVAPRKIGTVGVLGAGLLGSGIAYVTIDVGIPVRVEDRDNAALGLAIKRVTELLEGDVKRQRLARRERDEKLMLLTGTTDLAGMTGADLVIEAVAEDLGAKREVLRAMEASGDDRLIFASTSTSIPITKIAERAARPGNVVGMHYNLPVHRTPILEVIQTRVTSPEVVATAVALGKQQGKTVIVLNDGPGFYLSRICAPMMNEAIHLLGEGLAIEVIDQAMTAWGWSTGPLALLDEVGLDLVARLGPILAAELGARLEPPPILARLVAGGRSGRRSQRGLYLHGAAAQGKGEGRHADPSVYGAAGLVAPDPKAKPRLAAEEIQMRCSLQLVNEAARCLGEGILRSARDGDLGAVHGLGFPPFRGGPFRYVDALGAGQVLRRIEGYRRLGERWTPAPVLVEMATSGGRFYP